MIILVKPYTITVLETPACAGTLQTGPGRPVWASGTLLREDPTSDKYWVKILIKIHK